MRKRVSVFHHASVGTDVFAIHAYAILRDRTSLDNAHFRPVCFFSHALLVAGCTHLVPPVEVRILPYLILMLRALSEICFSLFLTWCMLL